MVVVDKLDVYREIKDNIDKHFKFPVISHDIFTAGHFAWEPIF